MCPAPNARRRGQSAGLRYRGRVDSEPDSIFSRTLLPTTSAVVATIAVNAFSALAVVAGLPQITAELGDVALLSWVITGFLVSATVATMVAGQVIDSLGVRTTFRLTMLFAFVGSAVSATATSMEALVVFRCVQGVGAGFAFSVATTAIGLAYPERLRSRALAAASVTWGVMALGAPTIAALFVATTGWRGIFLAILPIVVVATVLGWRRLPDRQTSTAPRVSFEATGALILGAFTVVSLLGLSTISALSVVAVGVAAVLAVAYWVYAGGAVRPVLALKYLAHHPIGTINVASGLAFGAALGIDAYLPVFVRGGLGYSSVLAAFSVAFLTLGWTAASLVMTKVLDRFSETGMAVVGYSLLIPVFVVGLTVYDTNTPIALVLSMAFVLGAGVGTQSMSLLNLLYRVSETAEVGRASSAHQYLRSLFQTYAAALVGAIMLAVVRVRLGSLEGVQQLLAGDEGVRDSATQQAIASAFRLGHSVPLLFAVIGLTLAIRLHRRLGAPQRRLAPEAEHL